MKSLTLNLLLASIAVLYSIAGSSSADAHDWSGAYGGISVSLHSGKNEYFLDGVLFRDSSFRNPDTRAGSMLGAHFGYRFQAGSFVFGPEFSTHHGALKMKNAPENKIDNYQQAVVKLGYATDRFLTSGGLGYFKAKIKPECFKECGKSRASGPVYLVALDYLINENITLGAAVQHRRFENVVLNNAYSPAVGAWFPGFAVDGKDTSLEIRLGFKF